MLPIETFKTKARTECMIKYPNTKRRYYQSINRLEIESWQGLERN